MSPRSDWFVVSRSGSPYARGRYYVLRVDEGWEFLSAVDALEIPLWVMRFPTRVMAQRGMVKHDSLRSAWQHWIVSRDGLLQFQVGEVLGQA